MQFAPNARPDDGRFDLVIMHATSAPARCWRDPNAVYSGKHILHPKVRSLQARRSSPRRCPARPRCSTSTGETPGRLPATFHSIPPGCPQVQVLTIP